ncbi:hypothetical protein Tco_0215532 [Tanacetum coccineum]
MEFTYALRFEFTATDTRRKYEALPWGYGIAARMGVLVTTRKRMPLRIDRPQLRPHLSKQVLVEILKNKSISEREISTVIEDRIPSWNDPHTMAPVGGPIQAGLCARENRRVHAVNGTRTTFCGGKALVQSPLTNHNSASTITSTWPFHKWGLDIDGPFPAEREGGLKHSLSWPIDTSPNGMRRKRCPQSQGNRVKKILSGITVCAFGLPGGNSVETQREKQFCDNPFKDCVIEIKHYTAFCVRLNIHRQMVWFLSEANRSLGRRIKGAWIDTMAGGSISQPMTKERRLDLDILEERLCEQAAIREEGKRMTQGSWDKWEGPTSYGSTWKRRPYKAAATWMGVSCPSARGISESQDSYL